MSLQSLFIPKVVRVRDLEDPTGKRMTTYEFPRQLSKIHSSDSHGDMHRVILSGLSQEERLDCISFLGPILGKRTFHAMYSGELGGIQDPSISSLQIYGNYLSIVHDGSDEGVLAHRGIAERVANTLGPLSLAGVDFKTSVS